MKCKLSGVKRFKQNGATTMQVGEGGFINKQTD